MFKPSPSLQKNKATVFLLAGIGFACLPHISFQPLSVIVICVLCLVWRVAVVLEWFAAPPKFVQVGIAVAAIVMIMHGQHYNLGKDAGISLLIAALTIKQIQKQDELNFNFSVCLAYFVAAAVFLYDHSILSFFCVGQGVVFVSLALYAHAAQSAQSTNTKALSSYNTVARLLFYATPLTLLLFFLSPDFKGPLWELPDDAYKAQTGLSSEMAPGKISSLADSNEVVFRVTFKKMPENIQSLYWRGPVFTYFDGQTWQSTGDRIKSYGLQQTAVTRPANEAQGFMRASYQQQAHRNGDDNEYQITLEPQYNQWLFTLTTPAQFQGDFYLTSEDELLSKTIVSQPLQYTLKVNTSSADDYSAPEKRRYLQLPNLYGFKTKKLLKQFQQGLDPNLPYDVQLVTKVLDNFSNNPYYYSKKPPLLKYDPIDEFMLKTRTGFCEHFASAFTFIMRAAGIPARVVTGYRGGEYNSVGGYVVVRQSDAHAWSEVWLQGRGWVRVDPTASIPPYRVRDERDTPYLLAGFFMWDNDTVSKLGDWLDTLSYRWYGFLANVLQARMDSHWLEWFLQHKQYLLPLLVLVLASLQVRRRWCQSHDRTDPVLLAYEKFCHKLRRLGLARLPHESASDYAVRVCEARPDLAVAVKNIASLYNQLRYGKDPHQFVYRQFSREIAAFRP